MTTASIPLARPAPAEQAGGFRTRLLHFSIWLAFVGSAVAGPLSRVELGPVSGQGALTIVLALLVSCLLASSAWRFRGMEKSLRPLAAFAAWYLLSFFWGPRSATAFQNALVMLIFVGFVFLCSWHGQGRGNFHRRVARLLAISTAVGAAFYAFSLLQQGPGAESIWGNRTFALFALPGLAWWLAGWRYGRRSCLLVVLGIILLIALSLSRLAFVAAILLFPLSQLGTCRRRRTQIVAAFLLCVALVLFGLRAFGPLSERFTGGGDLRDLVDTNAAVYTSGRVALWAETLQSALESIWIGKGVGSSGDLISEVFPGVDHPHNDYLRVLHDCGFIGLALFVASLAFLLRGCCPYWKTSRNVHRARLGLTSFLGLTATAITMLTDNTLVYLFVMAPLGVLVGTAAHTPKASLPNGRSTGTLRCSFPS